jgi:16S rRNA processing protein RimM
LSNNISPEKTFHAGWVKDAHGLKGELYIQLFAKKADWLDSFKEFWLKDKLFQITHHKVQRSKIHKDGLIVKPEGLNDRTPAEALKGAQFYIPDGYLEAAPEQGIFLKQILGFEVRNGDRSMGEILGFGTNGMQDLLRVKTPEALNEVLIPFVEAFLKEIDFDKRIVFMELPDGLDET